MSRRRNKAARHRDITGGDILPAADTRAVVAAFSRDRAAGDVDIVGGVDAIHVLLRCPAATADTCASVTALSADCATINIDLTAAPLKAAADAGGQAAAVGLHRAGVEIQFLTASAPAAADACAALAAADGRYSAAPVVRIALRAEVHICAVTVHIQVEQTFCDIPGRIAAADACGLFAALTRHRSAGSHQHMHLTLAAVLLDGRAAGGALQRAVPADEIQISRSLLI